MYPLSMAHLLEYWLKTRAPTDHGSTARLALLADKRSLRSLKFVNKSLPVKVHFQPPVAA